MDGRRHVVKDIDGGAELKKSESGKLHLRIWITAVVDGVRRDYEIAFGKYSAVMAYATARADAPGGREADAERLSAQIKDLTGRKPWVYRRSNGTIELVCGRAHLEGFKRYAELSGVIATWLEETGRRA